MPVLSRSRLRLRKGCSAEEGRWRYNSPPFQGLLGRSGVVLGKSRGSWRHPRSRAGVLDGGRMAVVVVRRRCLLSPFLCISTSSQPEGAVLTMAFDPPTKLVGIGLGGRKALVHPRYSAWQPGHLPAKLPTGNHGLLPCSRGQPHSSRSPTSKPGHHSQCYVYHELLGQPTAG